LVIQKTEQTTSSEWRHVSGILTYPSVKLCLHSELLSLIIQTTVEKYYRAEEYLHAFFSKASVGDVPLISNPTAVSQKKQPPVRTGCGPWPDSKIRRMGKEKGLLPLKGNEPSSDRRTLTL
jgi:hypothetical protein